MSTKETSQFADGAMADKRNALANLAAWDMDLGGVFICSVPLHGALSFLGWPVAMFC